MMSWTTPTKEKTASHSHSPTPISVLTLPATPHTEITIKNCKSTNGNQWQIHFSATGRNSPLKTKGRSSKAVSNEAHELLSPSRLSITIGSTMTITNTNPREKDNRHPNRAALEEDSDVMSMIAGRCDIGYQMCL